MHLFKELLSKLGINYNQFIRTTDEKHKDFVKSKFSELFQKKFIYKGEYEGYYCKSCESFFTNFQLINENCPDCGGKVELIKEESYFLEISKFSLWIENKLKEGNILSPKKRAKELINNFVFNLKDLSVTRKSFDRGISINEETGHIVYVWLDALLNYISAFSYENAQWTPEEVWSKNSNIEILQLVGKEITRFHSIYWPIILNMLGYREPKVFAHGWLITNDGEKMSKSKGNVIDPIDIINVYGKDSLRFFLINNIVTGEDGRFSESLLIETINSLLVNKYSNLISRTDAMVKKYFKGVVPPIQKKTKFDDLLFSKLKLLRDEYHSLMENLEFSNSTKKIINYVEELNQYIDNTSPWLETEQKKLATIMNILIQGIHDVTILFSTILVDSSPKVYSWLGLSNLQIKDIGNDVSNIKLNKIDHLFERIK